MNDTNPEQDANDVAIEVDDDGVEYVKMVQDDGYDIKIQDYVTTGNSSLDFDEDGLDELTGGYGRTATIVGGSITIDAPDASVTIQCAGSGVPKMASPTPIA